MKATLCVITLLLSSLSVLSGCSENDMGHHASHSPATPAAMKRQAPPAGATASISAPANGATVPTTFTAAFDVQNITLARAGIPSPGSGHIHIMINGEELPDSDQQMGRHFTHFAAGQAEEKITLAPGEHTLQIILGDSNHMPFDPLVASEKITITVDASLPAIETEATAETTQKSL